MPAAGSSGQFLAYNGVWATPPNTNTQRGIDDVPVNGQTAESISSNWAYDHNAGIGNSKHVPAAGSSGQFLAYNGVWATPPNTNIHLSSVSGTGDSTVTFTMNDSSHFSHNFQHSHSEYAAGTMSSFIVEDGDGSEVSITNLKEWKFVEGNGININWTDTSTGSDTDPFDLSFSLKALTANWDAGGYEIRSKTFESDVTTGTAPFVVASTTLVSNLNADLLDGLHIHTGRNDVANRIIRTDSSGYLQTGYINTSAGNTVNIASDYYVNTNDGYIRKKSLANVQNEIGGGWMLYGTKAMETHDTAGTRYEVCSIDGDNWEIKIVASGTAGGTPQSATMLYRCVEGEIQWEHLGKDTYGGGHLTRNWSMYEIGPEHYGFNVIHNDGTNESMYRIYASTTEDLRPPDITIHTTWQTASIGTLKADTYYPFYRWSPPQGETINGSVTGSSGGATRLYSITSTAYVPPKQTSYDNEITYHRVSEDNLWSGGSASRETDVITMKSDTRNSEDYVYAFANYKNGTGIKILNALHNGTPTDWTDDGYIVTRPSTGASATKILKESGDYEDDPFQQTFEFKIIAGSTPTIQSSRGGVTISTISRTSTGVYTVTVPGSVGIADAAVVVITTGTMHDRVSTISAWMDGETAIAVRIWDGENNLSDSGTYGIRGSW